MRNYLWVVEELHCGECCQWVAWPSWARSTRAKARALRAELREDSDYVTRIRQYLRREV